MSESEIMTIMIFYHFGTYRTFKNYYMYYVKGYLKRDFHTAVSYNRFVELMPRLSFKMMMFMKLYAFGIAYCFFENKLQTLPMHVEK